MNDVCLFVCVYVCVKDNDNNISKRVPDGDGNRLKGVEVGVTAGEILRDGGLALPPTPASPSRSNTRRGRMEGTDEVKKRQVN
jgi:hypothetical protein